MVCVRYLKRPLPALTSLTIIFMMILVWVYSTKKTLDRNKESVSHERQHQIYPPNYMISGTKRGLNEHVSTIKESRLVQIVERQSNTRKFMSYEKGRKRNRKIYIPYARGSNHTSIIKHLLIDAGDLNHAESEKGRELLSRIKTDCRDRICSEFLTDADKPHFKYCVQKTWKVSLSKYSEPPHSRCVFIDGSNKHPMALASYPGSGNTWVRGLVQKVTGLCIGGIYCDVTLRQNGYPGESIRSGITFLVKTHQTDPRWEGVRYNPHAPLSYFKRAEDVPVYGGGVFILRNPFHAMVSEFKRRLSESMPDHHVRTLGKEHFSNDSRWNTFVLSEAITWQQTVLAWLVHNMDHPVMVVKYEHLRVDAKKEIEKVLNFLCVPYSSRQLEKVLEEGYDDYRRPPGREFEHYTESQKKYVGDIVASIANSYDKLDNILSDYLEP